MKLGSMWFVYKLHRLHGEPFWLAAWRATKKRSRIGTKRYWREQKARGNA